MELTRFGEDLALAAIAQAHKQGYKPLLAPIAGLCSQCRISDREPYYNPYPLSQECRESLIGMTYWDYCDAMPALYAEYTS